MYSYLRQFFDVFEYMGGLLGPPLNMPRRERTRTLNYSRLGATCGVGQGAKLRPYKTFININPIYMKRLTQHFTYDEMTRTDTGLENIPDDWCLHNLRHLCDILERVRKRCGFPLPINSAYRSSAVNDAVGGSPSSYHLCARAVDIDTTSMSVGKVEHLVTALWNENPIELIEHASYVHVAF